MWFNQLEKKIILLWNTVQEVINDGVPRMLFRPYSIWKDELIFRLHKLTYFIFLWDNVSSTNNAMLIMYKIYISRFIFHRNEINVHQQYDLRWNNMWNIKTVSAGSRCVSSFVRTVKRTGAVTPGNLKPGMFRLNVMAEERRHLISCG